jgi:MFS transporter, OFA family, oxalate/formate antiporter
MAPSFPLTGRRPRTFFGTKNAGINYGLLFTAWGVAGILGPRIGEQFFDKYENYQAAFCTATVLAAVALICELLAKRPPAPLAGKKYETGLRVPA